MIIEVLDVFENTIFKGEAEVFLYCQNNDTELEILLDKLESMCYYSFVNYYDFKIERLNPWEEEC